MDLRVNIRHALILALGTTPNLKETIELVYNQKKNEYQEAFSKSFKDDKAYLLFSVKYQQQIAQISGIVEHCYETDRFLILYSIIKKGYPKIYKLITTNKVVTMEKMTKVLFKDKSLNDYEEFELYSIYTVALFLTFKRQGTLEPQLEQNIAIHVARAYSSFQDSLNALFYKMGVDREEAEEMELFNLLEKEFNFKENFKPNLYLEKIIAKEQSEILGVEDVHDVEYLQRTPETIVESAFHQTFINGKESSFIGAISSLSKYFGLTEQIMVQELSESETLKLVTNINSLYEKNALDKSKYSKQDLTIVMCFIVSLARELQFSKEYLQETYREEALDKVREEFQSKIDDLQFENENLVKNLNNTKSKLVERNKDNEALTKSNNRLQKEVDRLYQELEKMKSQQKEVIALRDFAYSQSQQYDSTYSDSPTTVSEMVEEINKRNVAIVGGHENWVKKMKELLPNVIYIPIDKTGSFNALSKPDMQVFVNTMTNNHGNYYKLLSVIHQDSDVYYINSHVNINLSIFNLYNLLTNNK